MSIARKIKPYKWLRLPLVAIVVGAIALNVGCKSTAAVASDFETTALALLNEFNQNAVSFEEKYSHKTISVIGQILIIGEVEGVPILDIGTGTEDLYSIYAYFEAGSPGLKELEKGQFVRVVGTYTGQGYYTIELHDCVIPD